MPFIALSATPWARGLGKYYDDLIIPTTTRELIDAGFLSDFVAFAPIDPDLSGVSTKRGDYAQDELADAMDTAQITGDIVAEWLKRGEDRPTIAFCVNRRHAQHVCERFVEAGVAAEYIDGETPHGDDSEEPDPEGQTRRDMFARFESGETKILVSIGVLTTGFDADVRCIIDAQPTKSRILFVQKIGRGLRTAEGKDKLHHPRPRGQPPAARPGDGHPPDPPRRRRYQKLVEIPRNRLRQSQGRVMANDKRGGAIAVSIPEHLFASRAYRALGPLERCLLTELLAVAKRVGTEEPLNISVRLAADMCGVSKSHATRAMSELEARGFIVSIRRGEKRQRNGFASAWRITCLPFQGSWATCDYNRTHDRAHNRKVADDREGDEKFLTPELEALWVKTEASLAGRSRPHLDDEHENLLARMDAETRPAVAITASKSDPPMGRLGVEKRPARGPRSLYDIPKNHPTKSIASGEAARRWDI